MYQQIVTGDWPVWIIHRARTLRSDPETAIAAGAHRDAFRVQVDRLVTVRQQDLTGDYRGMRVDVHGVDSALLVEAVMDGV